MKKAFKRSVHIPSIGSVAIAFGIQNSKLFLLSQFKIHFNPQLKAETTKWKSEAEAFEDKAIALETKLSARDRKITDLEKIMEAIEKNQVVAAAEASAATEDTTLISQRADELQEALDRLQEDFRLQKIEVRIAERKATEEKERVVTLRGMLKEEREKIKKIEGRRMPLNSFTLSWKLLSTACNRQTMYSIYFDNCNE